MSDRLLERARAIRDEMIRQNPMLDDDSGIGDDGCEYVGVYDDYDNKRYDCIEIARAAI